MTENPTLKTLELTFSSGEAIRLEAELDMTRFEGVFISSNYGMEGFGSTLELSNTEALQAWLKKITNKPTLEHNGCVYLTNQIVKAEVI